MSRNNVNLLCLLALVLLWGGEGGISLPVDSPFPAEGAWLLVVSESQDLPAAQLAAQAEVIRKAVPVNLLVADFDKPAERQEFVQPLAYAKGKAGGQPYYIFRNGSRASEGPLTGNTAEILATLKEAVGVQ